MAGSPWVEVSWVEGDTPVIKWSLHDIGLNTDASLSGVTATITWFNEQEGWDLVTIEDNTVTIANDVMSWTPATTDLPCAVGYNGSQIYYAQVKIIFGSGEIRSLPPDKSLFVARVWERND